MNNNELFVMAKNMLIEDGIRKINQLGYTNATKDNVFTDAVYSKIFSNNLKAIRGQDKRLDNIIEDILMDIFKKQSISAESE